MGVWNWFRGLRRRWQVAIGLLVAFVLLVAITPSAEDEPDAPPVGFTASPTQEVRATTTPRATSTPRPATPTPAPTVSDAVGRRACADFENLVRDINSGVLTPQETRAGVQKVHDNGQHSAHKQIATHSTQLLRGVTTGASADIQAGMAGLTDDCTNP